MRLILDERIQFLKQLIVNNSREQENYLLDYILRYQC